MEHIINLGVLAHVDAGKTSVTEQLLYLGGTIRKPGSVDSGTSQTDTLAVEQRRGISVRAACATLEHNGVRVNLIDTPGHVDFAGEVERSLRALDGAVLIVSAAEGVQSQTKRLWKALEQMELPVILLINKIDRTGCDCGKVLADISESLSPALLPMQTVENEGTASCCVSQRDWQDRLFIEEAAPLAAESNQEIETLYLEDNPIPTKILEHGIKAAVAARKLFPVYFASAKLEVGIQAFLDGLTRLLPQAPVVENTPVSGVIFKVEHDPAMGKVAHARLFGGVLHSRDAVAVLGREGAEKITQIRRFNGRKSEDTGILRSGEIGALYGLSSVRTGDVLGETPLRSDGHLAVPLLKVQVFPSQGDGQLPGLVAALQQLSDEDPLLDLEWVREERELNIRITGMIQLEVLAESLKDRYGIEVFFSSPSVIYKETPTHKGRGLERYTMPKPCWAVVELEVEPLPRGSGVVYQSAIKGGTLPYRYQNHIETSLFQTIQQGVHGWEVTDAKFTLVFGEHHNEHTHPLDFFVATPVAVLRTLSDSGSTLLEPVSKVSLTAGEELLGKVIGDILHMRGSFDTPILQNGEFTLEALLPVASSLDYPMAFRSMTSGKGQYYTEFHGYQECPLELGAVCRRRGADPLDRSKWILTCRSAMD